MRAGLVASAYQGGESGLNEPELPVDIQKEVPEFCVAHFGMLRPCLNTAAVIKIHSCNKIYSLC